MAMNRAMVLFVFALASTSIGTPAQAQDGEEIEDFGGWQFSQACVSKGADGSIIDSEPLPVGGDRWMECVVNIPRYATHDFVDWSNRRYCALGEATSYRPEGTPDYLEVQVLGMDAHGDVTLQATSKSGETYQVSKVAFFETMVWPLVLNITYNVFRVDEVSNDVTSCDDLYGL